MMGFSVIICTHNGAVRLPQVLRHLSLQEVAPGLCWEVLVIDNASTDNTADIARLSWPDAIMAELRVIREPDLGTAIARQRGLDEAKYEVMGFVDDDNLVALNWIQNGYDIIQKHADVGACGGLNEPICETEEPFWFSKVPGTYAVGAQSAQEGDVTWTVGVLHGAGLCIRKTAWVGLRSNGFSFAATGRIGLDSYTYGEDTELCLALRLNGWKIWYSPDLRIKHLIKSSRLKWDYVRKIHKGNGQAGLMLEAYFLALNDQTALFEKFRHTWQWQVISTLKALLLKLPRVAKWFFSPQEGDLDILWVDQKMGRLSSLLKMRRSYNVTIEKILGAKWRQ